MFTTTSLLPPNLLVTMENVHSWLSASWLSTIGHCIANSHNALLRANQSIITIRNMVYSGCIVRLINHLLFIKPYKTLGARVQVQVAMGVWTPLPMGPNPSPGEKLRNPNAPGYPRAFEKNRRNDLSQTWIFVGLENAKAIAAND